LAADGEGRGRAAIGPSREGPAAPPATRYYGGDRSGARSAAGGSGGSSPRANAVTVNTRAFRVLVRNALFHRVKLAAFGQYDELGALDADSGWDASAWEEVLDGYFELHDEIGTGPDARGSGLLIIDERPGSWAVRQIFDDPAGDHDWGISAVVDLAASDEAGSAVLRITDVGQL